MLQFASNFIWGRMGKGQKKGSPFGSLTEEQLGMISHKMSLITIFGHKHKIKNIIKKFYIFLKKNQQPSILVYI